MDAIAIFDIGKTNQKLFVFDEDYKVIFNASVHLPETKDEDGFPCEDVAALSEWVTGSFTDLLKNKEYHIKAVNVSAHGASFVNVGDTGKPVTPLYNYLKPYPEKLKEKFYARYGGEAFAVQTASPVLGNLNSGMQLYWLKHARPESFRKIKYALHLPEYISFLISGKAVSGITSIGCHTNLWDFSKNNYHPWVHDEEIFPRLAPLFPSREAMPCYFAGHSLKCGIGLHDSSAALIPYLKTFQDPFVLLSTGTWNISLNPFNVAPLTAGELAQDCLCYLTFEGKAVKASRLFAGHDHDEAVKTIAGKFNKGENDYKLISFARTALNENPEHSFEAAYHRLVDELVQRQKASLNLVLGPDEITTLFVDGGFCDNGVFMTLLARAFPSTKIRAAKLHQASALGAALAIHDSWNTKPLARDLISLRSILP